MRKMWNVDKDVVGSKPQNSPVTLATTYMVIINYVNAQFPIL